MTALVVTLAVVVALLVVLVAGLLRSHAEILRTLHDAGLGHDPDAGPAAAPRRRAGGAPAKPTAGPSPEASDLSGVTLADPSLEAPGGARVVVVTMSPDDESVGALRRLAGDAVPVVMSTPAWEAYEVEGSPYFVYVDGV